MGTGGFRYGRARSAGLMALLAAVVGTWPIEAAQPPEEAANVADRTALLEAHNHVREAEKLAPLRASPRLEAAALAHARDMARAGKMSHEGTDGSTPAQRIERQRYRYRALGENVAAGQRTVEEVMRTWLDSPPHRKNIVGDFTEMGSACVRGQDGTPYWCVDFGRPLPVLDPERAVAEAVAAINQARTSEKKDPLKVDARLGSAAMTRARDMAEHAKLRSRDDDGVDSAGLLRRSGYRFRRMGEVSASGAATPEELLGTWLDDPANRRAVLGDFREVGVGYATTEKGVAYWCAILATPLR